VADLPGFVRGLAPRIDDRVSLIGDDGRVLADSDLQAVQLDLHDTRPEIVVAGDRGLGVAERQSTSARQAMLYVAVRVDEPGSPVRFVRVAMPSQRVDAPLARLGALLLVVALAAVPLGLLAAAFVSRSLRARAEGLAAFVHAVGGAGPAAAARAPLARATDDEFVVLERHLESTAADLATYVAALAEQRRRIEAILGSMAEGLLVLTPAGEVLVMNGVAERVLGVEEQAWRGRRLLEVTRHPDLNAIVTKAAREGRADGEVSLASPGEVYLHVSVAPLRGADDAETLGHVVVLRDMTRLKKLERIRTDFVANVSHELKTPLAAIRAALETLHDWALEDPAGARRWVAMSLGHAERMQRLVDDLLHLSEIELRQVQLSRGSVELAPAVDEAFGLLAAKAEARGVALVQAIPGGFLPLLADRNRLIQILVNLVDNAVKFTPEGGRVTVSGERLPGRTAAIVVADTGVGVPKPDLPRLGERFYRVDKGRSREAGGTGLGLAIVKHLTQIHGGRLEIQSELGKGTTVRVLLPEAPTAAAVPGLP
jgi:two-component system phosphate regulon sensor histidine kinase PhoR